MNKRIQELADQCRTEYRDGHGGFIEQFDEEKFAELIAAAEREACALVCEQVTAAWSEIEYNEGCMDCSKAIRARGEA